MEIFDNIARDCGKGRGGIFSATFIPCDGITFSVTEGLATIGTQTKVAKTITLDPNSGFFKSTSEGDRANMSIEYTETCEMTIKNDELLTDRIIESLCKGLHIAIVEYANGKNKIFGNDHGMSFLSDANSGTNGTDLNGTVVTGEAKSGTIPPHISSGDLDTIKAFVV